METVRNFHLFCDGIGSSISLKSRGFDRQLQRQRRDRDRDRDRENQRKPKKTKEEEKEEEKEERNEKDGRGYDHRREILGVQDA